MYQTIKYEVKDSVGYVTISRPETLNALNKTVLEELFDVFNKIDADDSVRVVILTGEGRSFVAGADIGQIFNGHHTLEEYTAHLVSTVTEEIHDLRIVIDCANGAASKTVRRIFNRFDCNVTYIHDRPNGTNINNGCGSTHLEDLAKRVVEGAYDVGIAFDGDADRCLVVDERGRTVDGDQIMAICAARLKAQGKLQNNGFVATIMSNLGLHKFAKEHDMNLLCSGVGDRHVLELMREKGLILGGEQSGHIIFLNHMTTGDGQLAALQFLQILSTSGMTVSQLAATVPQYPQHLENVKAPFEKADKQALLWSWK